MVGLGSIGAPLLRVAELFLSALVDHDALHEFSGKGFRAVVDDFDGAFADKVRETGDAASGSVVQVALVVAHEAPWFVRE